MVQSEVAGHHSLDHGQHGNAQSGRVQKPPLTFDGANTRPCRGEDAAALDGAYRIEIGSGGLVWPAMLMATGTLSPVGTPAGIWAFTW